MPDESAVVGTLNLTSDTTGTLVRNTVQVEEPGAEPQGKPTEPQGKEKEEEIDWKAEARKWEKRAKENSSAAEELKALRESTMSEQEKAVKRAEEAERNLAAANRKLAVHEAAKVAGVDEALLERMSGDTAEEIASNAQALQQSMAAQSRYPDVPDAGNQSVPPITAEDIRSIKDTRERIRARAANPNLF